jgi:hypothetical protein
VSSFRTETYFGSVPVVHLLLLREFYENIETLLSWIKYEENNWQFCGDFKILSMLLVQGSGHTKYPCCMCEWDSRARSHHWIQKDWPPQEKVVFGSKYIAHPSLVAASKVVLPPLHIKLGVMKRFVKALNEEGDCFKYISQKFTALTKATLKDGIFTRPDIRKHLSDAAFESITFAKEKAAWQAFRDVVTKFLGNVKYPYCTNIVNKMLDAFDDLGCNMSLKFYFMHSHVDYFAENLGSWSEGQGERFHKDVKEIKRRYQVRWNINILADYCWMFKREFPETVHRRKGARRTFARKKQRLQCS